MTPSQINTLFNIIKTQLQTKNYDIEEITFEMNPDSVSPEKLDILKENGVSRLSLGIQSASDKVLKKIGRLHDFDTAIKALENAQNAGFQNISIDYITGIIGQSFADIDNFCALAESFSAIKHVSAYALGLESDAPQSIQLLKMDDERERELFHHLCSKLKHFGFERYEISNFSLPGYQSRHNKAYWTGERYIGFGPSASSFLGETRRTNICNLYDYYRSIDKGVIPYDFKEELCLDEQIFEKIILSLRLSEGLSILEVNQQFNIDFESDYAHQIGKNLERGLLEITEDRRLRLTTLGMDFASSVMSDFYE